MTKAALMTAPLHSLLWAVILVAFFVLRLDTSPRTYFQIDDQIVVWAVDDAVDNNNWQPDWYRLGEQAEKNKGVSINIVRDEPLHDHHYNFSGHMILAAALIKPLRWLGVATPTIVLLHHIALFWDSISLLFIVLAARQLGGQTLMLCSAVIYTVLPLAVQGSHYARPDALLTAMGSILLWLSLQYERWNRNRWLLLSGLTLGVATAGKASQLMLGIFPALACCATLLRQQQHETKKTLATIVVNGIALLIITLAVLQLLFLIGDMSARDFWLSVRSVQLYYQHPKPPDLLEHYSYIFQLKNILHYFYATLGWPLVIAVLTGAVSLWVQRQHLAATILIIPLLFFLLYFSSIPAFFDRSFCALSAAITLLAALGCITLLQTPRLYFLLPLTLLICWKPIQIQYHLQTDHLRTHHNDNRLNFQKQLKNNLSEKYGQVFWIKNIDRQDMFALKIPERPPGNPRIYVVEDLNDYNSQIFLAALRKQGYTELAVFEGDFADMPTNSLITVHEAARFVYFVHAQDLSPQQSSPPH